ncbi:MAG: adenosine kinase [Deltaproteobacteria bacterium]|jgi:sugar/nucleoside kinase (ribokinase family)|nr:adenosine kinase [Deltaproteobacteria bacterium]MBW2483589.1 adenosine kinase [Deltaproteobacteria bacterium]
MAEFEFKKNNRRLIVGIGSALVDILVHEDDKFIEKTGAAKGGMTLVDNTWIERILANNSGAPAVVAGGSACNTVVGVGRLGGNARFVGKCGVDQWGRQYENDLVQQNVDPALLRSESPTGRVLSIITPDAQRTMFTYLGASAETRPEDISAASFADAAVVHVEGYLLFNPDLIETALAAAKKAGALISLDLASFTVVEQSLEVLERLVADYVDILLANEDEARAFTGQSDETLALRTLAQKADIAVLKVGPRGSHIAHDGQTIHIQALGDGSAVDTTGAGDLWSAGFLFGLVSGYPLDKCGQLGSACGYEVCQVIGASIPEEGWTRIRKLL